MDIPPAPAMLELIGTLPAARPLLDAVGDEDGVYLVGGAVRDLLLGGRPVDLDLVVEGDAPAVAARIGERPVVHDDTRGARASEPATWREHGGRCTRIRVPSRRSIRRRSATTFSGATSR